MFVLVVVSGFLVAMVVIVAAAVQVRAVGMAAFVFVVVSRQAVLAFQMGESQADIAARRDPRHAHGTCVDSLYEPSSLPPGQSGTS